MTLYTNNWHTIYSWHGECSGVCFQVRSKYATDRQKNSQTKK